MVASEEYIFFTKCIMHLILQDVTTNPGFDTKGSPGVRDSQIIMPDYLFLFVGSPTDSLNLGKYDTKVLVLSFSVDSKRH